MTVPAPVTGETAFIPLRADELRVFRRKTRLPGPAWMERNIYVPVGSRPGLYRNANNPAMYGVLDWATRAHVRTVVMAKGIQVGGTLVFYGLLLREGEYSADNALIVMADEKTVRKLVKKRLQPMIDKSAALSAIKSADPDDTTLYSITLAHGFSIDAGWASSEMSVSSESYRVVLLDEISKYKTRGNIEDAKARTTVYGESKRVWIFSSPGVDSDDPERRDPLMVESEACNVQIEFHAVCPDCGAPQVMRFDRFRWQSQTTMDGSEESDASSIRRNRSASYACEHCPSRWNDWKRDKALALAMKDGWQITRGHGIEFPQSVFVHFPSWISPYVSLSDVAADWLEAQGDEEKLRKWHNRHAGASYRYGTKDRPHSAILALRDDRPEGLVPSGRIAAITIFADMQKYGFWYKVTAWGFGLEQESWTLQCGFLDSWEALRRKMFEEQYQDVAGDKYIVTLRGLDSGGGEGVERQDLSRTAEAYIFAAQNPGVILFKGRRTMSRHYSVTDLDRVPGTNRPLPGSAKLYTINTTFFKDKLAGKLLISPVDPGAWHLHKDVDEDFAKQMCAEYKDEKGFWECPRGKANHYWDCSANELALVEIAQVKLWPPPDTGDRQQGRRVRSSGVQ